MVGDGKTDDTAALQLLLDRSAGKSPVRIRKAASYYKLTGPLLVPPSTTLILEDGAELRWTRLATNGATFLRRPVRAGIFVSGDDFRLAGRGTLCGPSVAEYVPNEAALFACGESSAARRKDLVVDGDIEIVNWGGYGILAQFVDNVRIRRTRIHGVGYAGIMLASCAHIEVHRNEVGNIGPGTGGNAYGISFTHESAGYDRDPFAGSKAAEHPFCWDFDCAHNTVYDVPLWAGIDAHGGYDGRLHQNAVFNCKNPLAIATGSGDAADFGGENNSIAYNIATTARRDGSPTTVKAPGYAISCSGGAKVPQQNIRVVGNLLCGYGDLAGTSVSIRGQYVRNADFSANILRDWCGQGIYTAAGEGVMCLNLFGPVTAAKNSACICVDTSAGEWIVTGNNHKRYSGTAAAEGLRINSAPYQRCIVTGNDFRDAERQMIGPSATPQAPANRTPVIHLTGRPTAIDVSAGQSARHVWIKLDPERAHTLSDLTSARVGVFYTLIGGKRPTTFDDKVAVLANGQKWISTPSSTLTLLCVATRGAKFIEIARQSPAGA